MNFYKNGFVIAKVNIKDQECNCGALCDSSYIPWPLYDLEEDKIAQELTQLAEETWFSKYHMEEIAPDLNYAKLYFNHCVNIELDAKILLFETQDDTIIVDDKFETSEVLGYDCIGGVYHSYLQTEYDEYPEMHAKNIILNKYGLLDNVDDALLFIKLRQQTIFDGINIEQCWEEILVRISVVDM